MRKMKNVWKMLCACLCIGMAAFAFSACSIGIDSEGKLYIKPNNQYVENLDESTDGECSHLWNDGTVISSATCTEVGQKLVTCEKCHFTRIEDIPALGHEYYEDTILVEPTCLEKGLKLYSCYNGCGGYTEEMDMLEHAYDYGETTREATCQSVGEITYTCINGCHGTYTEEIPMLTHEYSYAAIMVAPTCMEEGLRMRVCVNGCWDTYTEPVPTIAHAYDNGEITIAPTCTELGERTHRCTYGCGTTYTAEVPALGHSYDSGVVTTPPTCVSLGVETFTCIRGCGDSYTESVAMIPHVYDSGVVTKEPNCTETGIMTFSCIYNCNTTYTEDIPVKHYYDDGVITTAPTCTETGIKTFTCIMNCGEAYTEIVPALGHTYDDGVMTIEPTCTEWGLKTFTCVNGCGTSYIIDVEPLGHTYSETITLAPTCTEEGEKLFSCITCNQDSYTEVISKLAHTYVDGVCDVCGELQPSEGLSYSFSWSDYTYTVIGIGSCTDKEIVIPAYYDGYPVVAIGDSAFYASDLVSVVIPNTVTSIASYAFYNTVHLAKVVLGENVSSIASYAFAHCYKLVEIYNKSSLSIVAGDSAYGDIAYNAKNVYTPTEGESKLTVDENGYVVYIDGDEISLIGYAAEASDLILPATITNIYQYALSNMNGINSVVIGNAVTNIAYSAFYGLNDLEIVYYEGTAAEWEYVSIDGGNDSLTSASVYYYSESQPADKGNWWCYVNGVPTVWTFDYSFGLSYSWDSYTSSYTVTSIGNCTDTDLVIPAYYNGYPVTAIGDSAFYGQSSLTSVTIPDTVTHIYDDAFDSCYSLQTVILGAGVQQINYDGFYNCGSISKVYYKGTQSDWNNIYFGSYNYNLQNATRYYYSETDPDAQGNWWHYVDGVPTVWTISFGLSYSWDDYTSSYTVTGMGNCTDTDLIIPAYHNGYPVTKIGDSAFYYQSSLTSVTIPDTVTHIYDNAFEDCYSLQTVILGAGVQQINYDGFYNCNSISVVYYKGTPSDWNNISFGSYNSNLINATRYYYSATEPTEEGVWWYYENGEPTIWVDGSRGLSYSWDSYNSYYTVTGMGDCTDAYLVIPAYYNGYPVKAIGNSAFYNTTSLISVTIPDTVLYIYDDAFDSCYSLQTVVLGAGVQQINYDGFYNCTSITKVYYKGMASSWSNISFGSYNGNLTGATRYYYSENEPTESGNWWHYVDDEPTVWTLDYSLGLSYTLNNDGASYTVTGMGNCTDTALVIPEIYKGYPVTAIGNYAFEEETNLTSVEIPDTVTIIGDVAFYNCYRVTSMDIPDNVTYIGNYAFYNCYNAMDMEIPAGVTYIGDYAFYNCDGLTSVKISDGITAIDDYTFYDCNNLMNAEIPVSVSTIGDYAFYNCYNLTSVVMDVGVTYIENNAFDYCTSLLSVYYKGSETDWGNISIYSGNGYLTSATRYYYSETKPVDNGNWWRYVDGVPTPWIDGSVGLSYSFNSSTSTYKVTGMGTCTDTNLVIPAYYNGYPVTMVAASAFSNRDSIISLTIPDTLLHIDDDAFDDCDGLVSVVLGSGVTNIDYDGFYSCNSLSTVYYKGTPSSWNNISFGSYNTKLTGATRYYYSENVPGEEGNWWHYENEEPTVWTYYVSLSYTLNDDGASYTVTGLGDFTGTDLIIPATYNGYPVTAIGDSAFQDCDDLTSVVIGGNITAIGEYAFYNCYRVTSMDIPDSVTTIGEGAFATCYSLMSVEIPDRVTSIGEYAFYNCENLTSIDIPDSVIDIGSYAFTYCYGLTSVVIGNGIIFIGDSTFLACTSLSTVYYKGSESEWGNISIYSGNDCLTGATRYYYSETEPMDNGAWWHYVDGVPTIWEAVASVGLSYSLNSDGESYKVTGMGNCTDTNLVIPAYYNGYPVTMVAASAFYNRDSIISLTIPDTLLHIDDDAFEDCDGLVSVVLGSGVQYIDYDGFYSCNSLSTVYYKGTPSDWNNISFGDWNSALTGASRYYYSEEPATYNWWCFGNDKEIIKGTAVSLISGDYYTGSDYIYGSVNVSSTQSQWYKIVAPCNGVYDFYMNSGNYTCINAYYESVLNLSATSTNISITMIAGETYYIEVFGTSTSTASDTLLVSGPGLTTTDAISMASYSTYTVTIPAGCYVWLKTNTAINYNDYCSFSSDKTITITTYYQSGSSMNTVNTQSSTSFTIYGYSSTYYTHYYRLYASEETTVTVYFYT